MLDLNPYRYDSVESYEFERDMAKRNLEMVVEATARRIVEEVQKNAPPARIYDVVIEASETVVTVNQTYKYKMRACEEKKATQAEGN